MVRVACDGEQALAALEDWPHVDLLVTCAVLPGGISGGDLARIVREERPSVGVLIHSGRLRLTSADGRSLDHRALLIRRALPGIAEPGRIGAGPLTNR